MKVKILTPNKNACDLYRCIFPAQQLEGDIDIDYSTSTVDAMMRGKKIVQLNVDADVVVLPRPGNVNLLGIIPVLQRRGIAVVAEIDDDFQAIPRGHINWKAFQPHLNPKANWQITKQICNMADLVTATTPALLDRYAKHGRGIVIPNYIKEDWLDIREDKDDVVGWPGNVLTHADDLEEIDYGVKRFINRNDYTFRHLGEGNADKKLGVDGERIPWTSFENYPREVAKFLLGIAPLADNSFNESKSWLKPLELAALGVPVVMSPRSDYERLHKKGVGLLAKRPRDWYNRLEQLSDEAFREEVIGRGLEVAKELTIENNAWRFADAWEQAIKNRKNND